MNNTHYGKGKSHATPDSLWVTLYGQGLIDTGIQKSKYYWVDVSWSIKIKLKGGQYKKNVPYDNL